MRLQGQAALWELLHHTAPRAGGGAEGWWTLDMVPKTPVLRAGPRMTMQCQAHVGHFTYWQCWMGRTPLLLPGATTAALMSSSHPSPLQHHPFSSSAGVQRMCCSPPTAPAARRRVWALSPFLYSWHSTRSPSFLPTAPGRLFLPPVDDTSTDFIYSSVKPLAEPEPAVGSVVE